MPKTWLCCLIPSLFWIFLAVTIKSSKVHRCPVGKYGVGSSSGLIICKNCSTFPKCPDGMGMSMLFQCGDIIDERANLHCVHCFPGKNFSSRFDSAMCRPCRSMSCHPDETIDGECNPSEDTTRCTRECKRGYFSRSGQLDDCEPCSPCKGPKATRIKKCVDDNEPQEKQCEVYMGSPSITIATEQDGAVAKGKEKKSEQIKTGKDVSTYNVYGHPVLFSSLIMIIAVLCAYTLFQWQKRYCKRMKTSRSTSVAAVHYDGTGETARVEIVDENENNSAPVAVSANTSVQSTRRSSASQVKRKVSFNSSISNPASERNKERDVLLGKSDAPNSDDKPDLFDEEQVAASLTSVRKRSLSSSSAGRTGPRFSFSRQNSNPDSEKRNGESDIRKSKTFSNFSSILGQKGTAEETMPILSDDDNGINIPPFSINTNTPLQEQDILTKRPTELNALVYSKVCTELNLENAGKDWKALAGLMKYDNKFVKNLDMQHMKHKNYPAEALLYHWETKSGNNVEKLIELLKELERSDIIEILRQENP